jgi:hypothetical protein
MKPVVALDLSLFAVPSTAESSSEVEEILNRIRAWASVIERQNCVTFVTLSDAIDLLHSANCFPATHHIRALLQMHRLEDVFSAKDINMRLFSILQKAHRFVDIVGLEVVELEAGDISGADVSKSPDISILKSLACLLASVALAEHHNLIRVSTAFSSNDLLKIDAIVTAVEHRGGIDRGKVDIKSEVRVIDWPHEFLPSLDPEIVWHRSDDATQVHLAISLELARTHGISLGRLPLDGIPSFFIGSEFFKSLQSHGALRGTLGNIVRKKCSQVVLSKRQASPRPFKEIRGGDGASSFRVHLSKDHEAFRLMYWIRSDGSMEFANVGTKHALVISEGDSRVNCCACFA